MLYNRSKIADIENKKVEILDTCYCSFFLYYVWALRCSENIAASILCGESVIM